MSYRRRHRWFRRLALGLAFATAVFAGRVSVGAAKFDERGSSRITQPEPARDAWTFEWADALIVGIGAFVLVLGLGLAVGYLRRPRLAGL